MYITVCKDCTRRRLGCHGNCEDYIKEKSEHEKEREYIRSRKAVDKYINDRRHRITNEQLKKYGKRNF